VRPHRCDSCIECQQIRALLATRGRKKVGRTSVPWRLRAQLRATAIIAPIPLNADVAQSGGLLTPAIVPAGTAR
jgi:hypothetical protein